MGHRVESTGKTSRIAKSVDRILAEHHDAALNEETSPVIVTSLTRAAAAEATSRCELPPAAVGTVHSFGWRSQGMPPLPKKAEIKEWNDSKPGQRWPMGGPTSATPDDLDAPGMSQLQGDRMLERLELMRHQITSPQKWSQGLTHFEAAWSDYKNEVGVIDFADMIEHATPAAPLGCRVVIADEAQDCSALELRTLRRWAADAGALVLVGDTRQALYTWRGADPTSLMPHPGDDKTHRDTLSHSWRLPRAVHAKAEQWASKLSVDDPPIYTPRDEDGHAGYCSGSGMAPDTIIHQALERAGDGRTCLILGTCGYHIDRLICRIRDQGIPYGNPWRRKRVWWNPLHVTTRGVSAWQRVQALLDRPSRGELWTCQDVYRWASWLRSEGVLEHGVKTGTLAAWKNSTYRAEPHLLAKVIQPGPLQKLWLHAFEDFHSGSLLRWWRQRLVSERERKVSKYPAAVALSPYRHMVDDEGEPFIRVGTCHSVKGAEADCVWMLPDLSPAAQEGYMMGGAARDSVIRTIYVGMTRARHELHLCQASGPSVVW